MVLDTAQSRAAGSNLHVRLRPQALAQPIARDHLQVLGKALYERLSVCPGSGKQATLNTSDGAIFQNCD